jgi:hypothetical protein
MASNICIIRKLITSTFLSLYSSFVFAQGAPVIGNLKANMHQSCGKSITIQIANSESKHIILGLNNRNTGKTDLFISENPVEQTHSYNRYLPVKYDALSQTFLLSEEPNIDILWGNSLDNKQASHYILALGNFSYPCGELKPWLNDLANDWYGEKEESPS